MTELERVREILKLLVYAQPCDREYGSCAYCGLNHWRDKEKRYNTFEFPEVDEHEDGCPYRLAAEYLLENQ